MSEEVAELEGEQPEETGEDVIEESSASEESQEEPKPKAKGVQKRIDELTANWREEQRRAQQLQDQNIQLQQQMLKPPEVQEPIKGEPKLDDYSSYEEYVDARADYRADLKISEWKSQQEQATRADERVSQQKQFQQRAESFREGHEDFDTVAYNPSLPVSEDMVGLLNASEKGPELLYHLGQNPGEAARLAQLPTNLAAMELGRIEAQLGVMQPKTTTSAPGVIEPISGSGQVQGKNPDDMSMSEWKTWRENKLKK